MLWLAVPFYLHCVTARKHCLNKEKQENERMVCPVILCQDGSVTTAAFKEDRI